MEDLDYIKEFEHIDERPSPEDIHSLYSVEEVLGPAESFSTRQFQSLFSLCGIAVLTFIVVRGLTPVLVKKYPHVFLNFGFVVETLLFSCFVFAAFGSTMLVKYFKNE